MKQVEKDYIIMTIKRVLKDHAPQLVKDFDDLLDDMKKHSAPTECIKK